MTTDNANPQAGLPADGEDTGFSSASNGPQPGDGARLRCSGSARVVEIGESGARDLIQGQLDLDERLIGELESQGSYGLLSSTQKRIVLGNPDGPTKVVGGPGTGKTLVAMHRARVLGETGETVLLCSYSKALPRYLGEWIANNCSSRARGVIVTTNVHQLAVSRVLNPVSRLKREPRVSLVGDGELERRVSKAFALSNSGLSWSTVRAEWREVVLAQSIRNLAEYQAARRTGLGRRFGVRQAEEAWRVFGPVIEDMRVRHEADFRMACRLAREWLPQLRQPLEFDAVIVDEYQDLHLEELRFLEALCRNKGHLLLCGDSGQRIFAPLAPLADAGINIEHRTHVLRQSFRSTRQVIETAEQVLGTAGIARDADGDDRLPPFAAENGRPVRWARREGPQEELEEVVETVRAALERRQEATVGILVLTNSRHQALWPELNDMGIATGGQVKVATMHGSKGLEFDTVILPGLGEEHFPDPDWAHRVVDAAPTDDADLRRVLHVALSRAREELVVVYSGQLTRYLMPGETPG